MKWNDVRTTADVDCIVKASYEVPQVIFKHSTRCFISSMVLNRLESDWKYDNNEFTTHFLDVISLRHVSNYISDVLQIHHESPQLMLISKGEVVFDESHQDIYAEELKTVMIY